MPLSGSSSSPSVNASRARDDWLALFKSELKAASTSLSTDTEILTLVNISEYPPVSSSSSTLPPIITTLLTHLTSDPPANTPAGKHSSTEILRERILNDLIETYRSTFPEDWNSGATEDSTNKTLLLVFLAHVRVLASGLPAVKLFSSTLWTTLFQPLCADLRDADGDGVRVRELVMEVVRRLLVSKCSTQDYLTIGETVIRCWIAVKEEGWENVKQLILEASENDKETSEVANVQVATTPLWRTVQDDRLELALLYSGVSRPKEFYLLLYRSWESPSNRLVALNLLSKFVSQACPNDAKHIIIDTPMFEALIKSCMWEILYNVVFKLTNGGKELGASVDVDWLLMQHGEDLQMDDMDGLNWGSASLMQSVLSDKSEPSITPIIESTQEPFQNNLNLQLTLFSTNALRRAVDLLFTVLYGIFPVTTVTNVRNFLENIEEGGDVFKMDMGEQGSGSQSQRDMRMGRGGGIGSTGVAGGGSSRPGVFRPAPDPFEAARSKVLDLDVLDMEFLVERRLKNLIKVHRMHPNVVFTSSSDELAAVSKSTDNPSDVMVECIALRCPTESGSTKRLGDLVNSIFTKETAGFDAHMKDLEVVYHVNGILRQSVLDVTSSWTQTRGSSSSSAFHGLPASIDPLSVIRTHLYLILNELNFEICMRACYQHHVITVKKARLVDRKREDDRENM
ncbi:hypothetical protein HDU76_013976, partial [Blyttiomyces sp. JEL0837]